MFSLLHRLCLCDLRDSDCVKKRLVSPLIMVVVAACILLPSSWAAYRVTASLEQREYERTLEERAAGQFSVVRAALNELVGVLSSLRSFIEIKGPVQRWEFEHFIVAQNISDYGIASFEWLPKVAVNEADDLTRQLRAEGQFDFTVRQPDVQPKIPLSDVFPLLYSSSSDMDGIVPGTNLAAFPEYNGAFVAAAQSAGLQIAIVEPTGESEHLSRLIFGVFDPQEEVSGYPSLFGYVSVAIDIGNALEVLFGQQALKSGLCVQATDITAAEASGLFRSSHLSGSRCRYDVAPEAVKSMAYSLGGRQLRFTFYDQARPGYLRWFSLSNLVGLALLGVSIIVLMYIYTSRRYALKIERLFTNRTLRLRAVKHEYSQLFMLSVDGIYRASVSGRLLKANPAFAAAFGFRSQDILQKKVQSVPGQLHHDPEVFRALIAELKTRGRVVNFEWQGMDSAGQPVWLVENAYIVDDGQGDSYYEGSISVITERKLAQLKLQHQAERDALTGLYNRPAFVARIDQHIEARGAPGTGLFFIDLDRFKAVNDTYGHAIGDELLQQFSARLTECFRESDPVARFGGDEFAVFVTDVADSDQLQLLASRVLATMQRPFRFSDGNRFQTTASLGLSLLDKTCQSAEDGLRQADLAMYEVKRNGRDSQVLYDDRLNARAQRRICMELCLRDAIENHEFVLFHQPVVALRDSRIEGSEALLRWFSPQLGSVSPVEFIPLAEELNLIQAIGDWVLQQAVADLAGLIRRTGNQQLFVNVNVSPKQLLSNSIVLQVSELLSRYQLQPHNLRLEVTESALYSHEELAIKQLQALQNMGVGIYIDDFGTGHSSLERLVTYPLSGLKIDRSFVSKLAPDNTQAIILQATVRMAELLGLTVAAEGIESFQQQQFFADLDCQYGQGFLFYKPLQLAAYARALGDDSSDEDVSTLAHPFPV